MSEGQVKEQLTEVSGRVPEGSVPYQVLLYYKYVAIENPEEFVEQQKELCDRLNLKGRILVAAEGINGTVSGTVPETEAYMKAMKEDPRFSDMPFKIDEVTSHAFPKLRVRVRPELVTFRADREINPNEISGTRLKPKEFFEEVRRALESEDVVILDGRNDYEYDMGHFRNAIRPDVHSFKEFPQWIRENMSQYKDKKVLTYCTGGIRCEKLSGFLLEEGFKDVAQLDGGIVTYGKDPEAKGQLFDGQCYVFDERIGVPINQVEHVVVGKCHHCSKPTETMINCRNDLCHHQHLCCEDCLEAHRGYCTPECETSDGALRS